MFKYQLITCLPAFRTASGTLSLKKSFSAEQCLHATHPVVEPGYETQRLSTVGWNATPAIITTRESTFATDIRCNFLLSDE